VAAVQRVVGHHRKARVAGQCRKGRGVVVPDEMGRRGTVLMGELVIRSPRRRNVNPGKSLVRQSYTGFPWISKDVNPAGEVTNYEINKRTLTMILSVLFGSGHSSLNKGEDLDHSPGDSLSTTIDRLQQESVDLTNRIIELIRVQSNDD
jgi:hypothetical protein